MSKCINIQNDNFKSLVEISGISSIELAAKMNLWMSENDTDIWPTLEQIGLKSNNIKPGVAELFESSPELAIIGIIEPEQNHILGYREDIEGFKEYVGKSNEAQHQLPQGRELEEFVASGKTTTVNDVYSPLFTKINDDNLEEDDDTEPLMNSDTFEQERGYLSDEEKSQFETKPFVNLTQTLVYQLEDINNEIAELDGRMNNSSKTEFKQLSKDKAKLLLNKSNLIGKIKEAKQLNNLWQVVDFGNDAVEEVSRLMSDGNLTIKGLRYAERIANF